MKAYRWSGSAGIAAAALVALAVGCASGRHAERGAPEREGPQEVMYSPPEDDEPPQIPKGAPVLEEYARPTSTAQPDPPAEASSSGQEGTIERQTLEAILEQGPAWGLAQVQVEPARQGGRFAGFVIRSFSPAAAQAISPPLEVGDVITHINGVRIERPDDYMEAWKLARSVPALRVDYVRDEQQSYSTWRVQD